MREHNEQRRNVLARIVKSGGEGVAPLLSALAAGTHPTVALGAAVVTFIAYFGPPAMLRISARRAQRLIRTLSEAPELSLSDYRAVWGESSKVEQLRAELYRFLNEIDTALSDEHADVLCRILKYRTREPNEHEFVWRLVGLVRSLPTPADLNDLERIVRLAVDIPAAKGINELALFIGSMRGTPFVAVRIGDKAQPLAPIDLVSCRRLFRALRQFDFAVSLGMGTGRVMGDTFSQSPQNTQEDNLVIARADAVKLLDVTFG